MRIIGGLILLIASSVYGFMLSRRECGKLTVISELNAFAKKLIWGIGRRIPVDDIAKRYMADVSPTEVCGNCREELYVSLERLCKEDICRQEAKMCAELLDTISKSMAASEIEQRCMQFSDIISEKLAIMKKECLKKKELYMKLGVFVGLLVCITVI